MKKLDQPFETEKHDLSGLASVDFYDKDDFNSFAFKIVNYNPDRFDPVALRIFVQKRNPVITLFAIDKFKQEQSNYKKSKLPVRKFKIKLSWDDFIKKIKRFNFTVSNNAYDIKDLLVINK